MQLFDRVGRRLVLNENGSALWPRAASIVEQAAEIEALFSAAHAAPLRLASSFTIGEYLLPPLISQWKAAHAQGQVTLAIANARRAAGGGQRFRRRPRLHRGRAHRARLHRAALAQRRADRRRRARPSARRAARRSSSSPRRPGSCASGLGTREASDRWLSAELARRGRTRAGQQRGGQARGRVGAGHRLPSRHAVADALHAGWLVELKTRCRRCGARWPSSCTAPSGSARRRRASAPLPGGRAAA